jgi:hypothetical protein
MARAASESLPSQRGVTASSWVLFKLARRQGPPSRRPPGRWSPGRGPAGAWQWRPLPVGRTSESRGAGPGRAAAFESISGHTVVQNTSDPAIFNKELFDIM